MQELSDHPRVKVFLPRLQALNSECQCFLVGGAIRDWLLNRELSDFDFATAFDPSELARDFAAAIGGHCFFLDEQRRQMRVVVSHPTETLTFDFAPYRAATLTDDLLLRDFTINAMALPLEGPWCTENLIDPAGGRFDLEAGLLKIPSEAVLRSDPLRVVKGVRHAVELALRIDPDTLLRMTQAVPGLSQVAVERIRNEMLRIICATCETGRCISLLLETGIGRFFWGEQFKISDGLMIRAQFRSLQFWKILEKISPEAWNSLEETVEAGLTRRMLLQWVFMLKGLSPDCAAETARHWRFSRQAIARIEAANNVSVDLWQDFKSVAMQRRPLLLWAAQFGPDPIDLLLALAICLDRTPMAAVEIILEPLTILLEGDHDFQVEDLVDGHFLKRECGLEDGREIGRILHELRRAEMYGRVTSRDEAEHLALALCDKKD